MTLIRRQPFPRPGGATKRPRSIRHVTTPQFGSVSYSGARKRSRVNGGVRKTIRRESGEYTTRRSPSEIFDSQRQYVRASRSRYSGFQIRSSSLGAEA